MAFIISSYLIYLRDKEPKTEKLESSNFVHMHITIMKFGEHTVSQTHWLSFKTVSLLGSPESDQTEIVL